MSVGVRLQLLLGDSFARHMIYGVSLSVCGGGGCGLS